MVFKTTKRNVRSGNTLRSLRRGCYEQPIILKTAFNLQGHEDKDDISGGYVVCGNQLITDGFEASEAKDKVPYSLNKRGRWQLADILSAAIDEPSEVDASTDSDDVGISVLQHHLIKRQAACVGYHCTRPDVKRQTNTTYCNGNSFVQAEEKAAKTTRATVRPRKRKDHKWVPRNMIIDPAAGQKDVSPSLRYDIYDTPPVGRQVVYAHKIRPEERHAWSMDGGRQRRNQQKHTVWSEIRDYEDAMCDIWELDYESDSEGTQIDREVALEELLLEDDRLVVVQDEGIVIIPDSKEPEESFVSVPEGGMLAGEGQGPEEGVCEEWELIKCVADWAPEEEYNPPQ